MDRQQEIQESFNNYYQSFFPGEGQALTFLSSVSSATEKANECINKAKSVAEENSVVASGYYYLAGCVCFSYMLKNGMVDSLFKKGKESAKKAAEILPEDGEYLIFNLFYRILAVKNDDLEAEKAFATLQQIQKECPPFHIIKNTLFSVEWLEDIYNELFEGTLQDVYCKLEEAHSDCCKDAALLLKSFPAPESKLLAFYALSGIYLEENKPDEALRNAKLGVEVLGNNVEYDYHEFSHWLWGECWALVGNINREKKDFDFAESVLEKGARLGIISCMTSLAEMYENGEGDDPDPKEAERYRNLAKATQEERDKERQEAEERIRREEEARQAEIRNQEEAIRIAEEMKARKKEILARKILLAFGCVCCVSAIIWGLLFLKTDTILDHVVQYDNAGKAIISLYDADDVHSVIYMDKQGVFVDDMQDVKKILPLGVEVETKELGYTLDERGLSVTKTLSETPLIIQTSRDLSIKRMSSNAFLLSTNHASFSSGEISNIYHITTYDTDNPSVIWIDKGELSIGYIYLNFDGDVYPTYRSHFRKAFSQKENTEIVKRKYGIFSTQVLLSLPDGVTKMATDTRFPVLSLSCPSIQVGKQSFRDQMEKKIKSIFREEFVESLYNKAIKLTGVNNKSLMRLSPDDRYTFVIAHGYQSGENSVGLLKVDNSNNTVSVMDAGMEVAFQESRIYVKRYATFLLFFDSHKDVFYDYYGNMR